MSKMDEIIIVAPTTEIFQGTVLEFQGLLTDKEKIDQIIKNISENREEMRRGDAEEAIMWKQPIPYIILKKGDKVFTYKRLEGGGEVRLHGKMSIGVGGHMQETGDLEFTSVLKKNALRELTEELEIKNVNVNDLNLEVIGIINDDSTDVSKVHIGILMLCELPPKAEVEVKEKDQLLGNWIDIQKFDDPILYAQLENWSMIAVDAIVARSKYMDEELPPYEWESDGPPKGKPIKYVPGKGPMKEV